MEKNSEEIVKKNGIKKPLKYITWENNITELNIINKNLAKFIDFVKFPHHLKVLNLSENGFKNIPSQVNKLLFLEELNLSNNQVETYEETPNFLGTLTKLDISCNKLSFPSWIWNAKRLEHLILCHNRKLFNYVIIDDEIKSEVVHLDIIGCDINEKLYICLLKIFYVLESLNLGDDTIVNTISNNNTMSAPFLNTRAQVSQLKMASNKINCIEGIVNYSNVVYLDLQMNYIKWLPNEIGNLNNLKVLNLSNNQLILLPDEILQLEKLKELYLDNNKLCMLPDYFFELGLVKFDLYNNELEELSSGWNHIEYIDLSQNYFDEPTDSIYETKKNRLREERCISDRHNGFKLKSSDEEFTDEEISSASDCSIDNDNAEECQEQLLTDSTQENWDSDEYWEPIGPLTTRQNKDIWSYYMLNKIKSGAFCPIDIHQWHSVYLVNKDVNTSVVCGQFDDCSDVD